jgi:hypothetical protein
MLPQIMLGMSASNWMTKHMSTYPKNDQSSINNECLSLIMGMLSPPPKWQHT